MAVEIKLDLSRLGGIKKAACKAALAAMEAVKEDVVASQTMPFDVGTMQNSQATDQFEDGQELHTILGADTAYARRMYFHPEYKFQKINNPNAGAAWYAPYLPGGEKEGLAPEIFADTLRKEFPK